MASNHRISTGIFLALSLFLLAACSQGEGPGPTETAAPPPLAEMESDECVLDPPSEPMACTMQYDPVCGCDGKTYGNACMAGGAGVPSFEPGECVPSDAD